MARSFFLPADTAIADSLHADSLRTRSLPAGSPRHRIGTDTLRTDSLRTDSVRVDSVKPRKAGIDSPVEYQATDSMVYDAHTGLVTLYGKAQVNYLNMQLDAAEITMNMDSSLVHAQGRIDSTKAGGIDGKPVYKQGSDQYDSERMSFNFKTKKGYIQNVYTAQGNGFLQSQDLFAAPPENKGVAALQTADQLSFPGFFNDYRVDFLLGRGMSAAALAHVYPLRPGRTGAEQLRVDQVVVDQHVAAAELFQPPQGDQIRFPAARANKIYFSGLVIHFSPAPFRQEMRGSCLL